MTTRTTLSVRGEARRTVAPDHATLSLTARAPAGPRAEVLARLRAAQEQLIDGLRELGGAPLTVDTDRADLSWSFGSLGVHDEHDFDEATGRHGATGRVLADVSAVVTVRDLDLLPAVGAVLAGVEHLNVDGVDWQVDPDNAAWPVVRADAIDVALAKARDYAEALGATVSAVEHVADGGLLTGAGQPTLDRFVAQSAGVAYSDSGGAGMPTLDPVPQQIRATVEARVLAQIDLLPDT